MSLHHLQTPAADVRYLLSYDRTVQVCVPNTPELFRMAWGQNYSTHPFDAPFIEMDAASFIAANRAARTADARGVLTAALTAELYGQELAVAA